MNLKKHLNQYIKDTASEIEIQDNYREYFYNCTEQQLKNIIINIFTKITSDVSQLTRNIKPLFIECYEEEMGTSFEEDERQRINRNPQPQKYIFKTLQKFLFKFCADFPDTDNTTQSVYEEKTVDEVLTEESKTDSKKSLVVFVSNVKYTEHSLLLQKLDKYKSDRYEILFVSSSELLKTVKSDIKLVDRIVIFDKSASYRLSTEDLKTKYKIISNLKNHNPNLKLCIYDDYYDLPKELDDRFFSSMKDGNYLKTSARIPKELVNSKFIYKRIKTPKSIIS